MNGEKNPRVQPNQSENQLKNANAKNKPYFFILLGSILL